MISLFLNTFSKWLHVSLVKDNEVIDDILESCGNDLSEEALFSIKTILDKNSISMDDLTEIVCVKGPGSFTGLRIGVTIAKTMAYFKNIKLYSTSSLDVMATSVTGDIIVPMIDARRGYVYGAIYDSDYNVVMEECYIKLEELIEHVKMYSDKPIFVSSDEFDFDVVKFEPNINNFYNYGKKQEENSMTFVPNYLKRTEAEEKLNDSRY